MKRRIDTLTTLRFFMIMTIVISHLEFWGGDSKNPNFYDLCLDNAKIGVNFFFILSGFGLTYSRLVSPDSKDIPLRESVKWAYRRMGKLKSLYLITMTIGLGIALFEAYLGGAGVKEHLIICGKYLFSLSMLQSMTGMVKYSHLMNDVCWFVSTLLFLYMAFPLLWMLNKRIVHNVNRIWIVLIILIISTVFSSYCLSIIAKATPLNDMDYGHPVNRIFYFAIGILLCDLFTCSYERNNIKVGTKAELLTIVIWGGGTGQHAIS